MIVALIVLPLSTTLLPVDAFLVRSRTEPRIHGTRVWSKKKVRKKAAAHKKNGFSRSKGDKGFATANISRNGGRAGSPLDEFDLLSEIQKRQMFGRTIEPMPDFAAEYERESDFPPMVDKLWAIKYLRDAYECQYLNPLLMELNLKSPKYRPIGEDVLKRLGSTEKEKIGWFLEPPSPGSVCPHRNLHSGYEAEALCHSFSNNPYRKDVYETGTAHVAIGFVDLGVLLAADLVENQNAVRGSDFLRFVGIDSSPYAVAKTHVIWEMLRQTPPGQRDAMVHLRKIAQVWYSTTWGAGTHESVKEALVGAGKAENTKVQKILDHWQRAPVATLQRARDVRRKRASASKGAIGHLLQKSDRMAMAAYELTGDFCVEDPVCGNLLMLDCPDGTPPLADDETVFSAFQFDEVVRIRLDSNSKGGETMTIVAAAEEYVIRGLERLAMWAGSGKVVVELKCSRFQDALPFIKSLRPWTMTWSNLCDYVDYAEFHRMARECSEAGDTIHYAYSMNWIIETYGTSLLDFNAAKVRRKLIDASNEKVGRLYRTLGWEKLLRSPPPQNPLNTVLGHGPNVMEFHGDWIQHFFGLGADQGPCSLAGVSLCYQIPPLSNSPASTLMFTWTYDPEINFQLKF